MEWRFFFFNFCVGHQQMFCAVNSTHRGLFPNETFAITFLGHSYSSRNSMPCLAH